MHQFSRRPPFSIFLLSALLLATALPTLADDMPETQLNLDLLFDDDAHGRQVERLAWRPGTDQLLGLWSDDNGDAFWLFSPDGSKSLLARPGAFGVETADDVGRLAFSDDGASLLLSQEGQLSLFGVAEKKLRALTEGEAKNEDAHLSPDGQSVAFVRENDLYVLDVESGEERRLTSDGEAEVVFNGTTDWVYWEEIWSRSATGFWWSGDSRRLAYYHFDDSELPIYSLTDTRPLYPEVRRQRYPKAGEILPKVEIRVVDLESGETVTLDVGDSQAYYLARVHWHPDDRHVVVERVTREQSLLEAILCSSEDGSCKVLAKQSSPTWVNISDEFTFLPDGRFLWSDDSTGWRRLYLYDQDGGNRRAISPEGWHVTSLDKVADDGSWLVFTGHATGRLGAAERHVFRVDLPGGEAHRLTDTPGWHGARVSDSGHFIHSFSDLDKPTRRTVRHLTKTGVSTELPHAAPTYDVAALPRWEIFEIEAAGGGKLPAQIVKPAGFDPAKKYPVVMYHYGCPASQVVSRNWSSRGRSLWHLMLAERGYVVLMVDNEISSFFDRSMQDQAFRRFGEIELAAQTSAVEYLGRQPWADMDRLGLWGWSGGGSNTLYSVLRRPGVWKAAIAGAPVTDWRYYDAIWIERYLDHPESNADGYTASSPITYADALVDRLMLIHGTADDNVHPQNTWNMVDALIEAGAAFELGIYPNMTHSTASLDTKGQRHVFARMTDFFERHLAEE